MTEQGQSLNAKLPESASMPFSSLHQPRIYAYSDHRFSGKLKIGFTTRKSAYIRVREQLESVATPKRTWKIELDEAAIRDDGSLFKDHDVHRVLESHGCKRIRNEQGDLTEWFECRLQDVQAALLEVKSGIRNREKRTLSFGMRPEQAEAVAKTAAYFASFKADRSGSGWPAV